MFKFLTVFALTVATVASQNLALAPCDLVKSCNTILSGFYGFNVTDSQCYELNLQQMPNSRSAISKGINFASNFGLPTTYSAPAVTGCISKQNLTSGFNGQFNYRAAGKGYDN